eukprot:TRINITY_DN2768_c0_g1_i1.p1 TRINITY_DN2768_c0_g1~~TRINITY_DN2768_c0_g1_i1.p1  ORF type:complete len:153 (+),score=53.98 TRINITY_DN2768_c0_g1_i1:66-524(+)
MCIRDRFYDELAKQINQLCVQTGYLEKNGGMVSLIDVYFYLNKIRGTALISPSDLMMAAQKFQRLGFEMKVTTLEGNVKVIQSTNFNQDADFEKNVRKFVDERQGVLAETLARKSGISLLIARFKLEEGARRGKLCLDNSIEGQRYYLNILL